MKRHLQIIIITFAIIITFVFTAFADDDAWLYAYFTGNGEDGLHLAYSEDGLEWKPLNHGGSYLTPMIGNQKLMRDPCVIEVPDGFFHMVWTVSWNDRVIGYANSPDLIHWSVQKEIPVMQHEETARNCWAPEIFYDEQFDHYVIFWSTTIPGRFPETAGSSESDYNHRIYCTTTSDFESFTATRLFFDPGFNCIDGTIIKSDDDYVMFFKDETLNPPEKNIKITRAASPHGPWGKVSKAITGDFWAEGPTSIEADGKRIVFFDKYRKNSFGAVASHDLVNWNDISGRIQFPKDVRHGTAIAVKKDVIGTLLDYDSDPVVRVEQAPFTLREVVYKTVGDTKLKLHIFEPEHRREGDILPAIVFYFGGGWVGGTATHFYPHCKYLASRGMLAVAAEYRVESRDGTTPVECVQDGKSAIRWMREHATELGIDPNRIAAGGGSAGGHVAAATGVLLDFEEDGENLQVSSQPDALVLFNPVLDTTVERWEKRVGEHAVALSPPHNVREDLPPCIIFNGTADKITPIDLTEHFVETMLEAGNVCALMKFADVGHGFFNWERHDNEYFRVTVKAMDAFLVETGMLDK